MTQITPEELRKIIEEVNIVFQVDPPFELNMSANNFCDEFREFIRDDVKPEDKVSEVTKKYLVSRYSAPKFWEEEYDLGNKIDLSNVTPIDGGEIEITDKEPEERKSNKQKGLTLELGILETIQHLLRNTAHPLTKAEITEFLIAEFPNREPSKMKRTVESWIPTRLNKERGMSIERSVRYIDNSEE